MFKSRITGTGSYLPSRVLTNQDLEKMVETSDEWITDRTGIKRRHIAADNEVTTDLAKVAATRALEAAHLKPIDIDMIILATVSGDQVMPASACALQNTLGCRPIFSFDLSAACSGFVYSLTIADQFIKTGFYKNILVVGVEILSRLVDYKDRETCILFGDGAGAMVVTRSPEDSKAEILSEHLYADGSLGDLLELQAGGSKYPVSQFETGRHLIRMKGKEIFKHAVRTLTLCCNEAVAKNKLSLDDISWLIPHQANKRILDSVIKNLGFPAEKTIVNLHETGNTSAASIPIAFDEAVRDGRIQRDQLVLLAAFGAGLTSGSVLLRY